MVATELAVFLLGETIGCAGGCSLDEARESHEKGLVSFLPIGAGGAGAGATAAGVVFVGESTGGGDQGIAGKALVMLLNDLVLDGSFSFSVELFSALESATAVAPGTSRCWILPGAAGAGA